MGSPTKSILFSPRLEYVFADASNVGHSKLQPAHPFMSCVCLNQGTLISVRTYATIISNGNYIYIITGKTISTLQVCYDLGVLVNLNYSFILIQWVQRAGKMVSRYVKIERQDLDDICRRLPKLLHNVHV